MYYCTYVMTGRGKTLSGKTAKEIHKKFLNEFGEAEREVRKVDIFKDDPTKLNISDIDSFLAFGKDFGMVISYDVFKEYLLTNKYTIDEMEFMCRGSDRRVQ